MILWWHIAAVVIMAKIISTISLFDINFLWEVKPTQLTLDNTFMRRDDMASNGKVRYFRSLLFVLTKQSICRWLETQWHPMWRHHNVTVADAESFFSVPEHTSILACWKGQASCYGTTDSIATLRARFRGRSDEDDGIRNENRQKGI